MATIVSNVNTLGSITGEFSPTILGSISVAGSAQWGFISGDITDQTDLQTQFGNYLTIAGAEGSYYPLSANPAGYQTASDLSTALGAYLPLAGGTMGGNITLGGYNLLFNDGDGMAGSVSAGGLAYNEGEGVATASLSVGGGLTLTSDSGASGATLTPWFGLVLSGGVGSGVQFPDSTKQVTAFLPDNYYTAGEMDTILGSISVAGSAQWGFISGDITDQTDLQSALDAKQGVITNYFNFNDGMGGNSVVINASGVSRVEVGPYGNQTIYSNDKILFSDGQQQDTAFNSTTLGTVLAAGASGYRTNLGLGTMATENAANYLTKAGNLAGLTSVSTARGNLGVYSTGEVDSLLSGYLSGAEAETLFYPLTANPAGYQTASDVATSLGDYYDKTTADGRFYPLVDNPAGYLIPSDLATALGNYYTITETDDLLANKYDASNPAGYISSASLAGLTDVLLTDLADGQTVKYSVSLGKWVNSTDLNSGVWGSITGDITAQTDLQTQFGNYLTIIGAEGTYYPLSANPAGYQTAGDVSTALGAYLPLTGGVMSGDIVLGIKAVTSDDGAGQTASLGNGVITFSGTYPTQTLAFNESNLANYLVGNQLAFRSTLGLGTISTQNSNSVSITGGSISGVTITGYLTTSSAASTYAPLVSPTFTGTVTIPSGASIAGYAPLSSPTFTGTPAGPTAAADTNTTQLATTGFVIGQAGSSTPLMDGTGTVGTSKKYARDDHRHPTDTSLLVKANNLSDLTSASTARSNLGLGSIATQSASSVSITGGTISGVTITGYLTTSLAASTYAPLASPTFTGTVTIPSGASIAGYAPLASPTFTGTPAAPTAAVDTNTTQLATTAYYIGQKGTATPLVDGTATAGTSAKFAPIDHVHPTDTSRIAVSDIATVAEAVTGTSTTKIPTLDKIKLLMASGRFRSYANLTTTSVSGSGAVTTFGSGREMYTKATGSAGRASTLSATYGSTGGSQTSAADVFKINFSKACIICGTCNFGGTFNGISYIGDANTVSRINFGGRSVAATGDLTQKGIGLKKVGGTSSTVYLTVHDGTTLTDVDSTITVAAGASIQYLIYSDGSGNVTLFINGTQRATTANGPTGTTTSGYNVYEEQVEATSSATVRGIIQTTAQGLYIEY